MLVPFLNHSCPDAFIKETKQVINILGNRIKRENQELYAAADRTEGKVFEEG